MRILWVKVGGLWPPNAGGRLRSFHLASELARRHDVVVATTHAEGEDEAALRRAVPQLAQVLSFPHAAPKQGSAAFAAALARSWASPLPVDLWRWRVPALRREVARRLARGDFDLCVADFLAAVPNVPADAPVPTVLFAHNVEHVIWRRLAEVETTAVRRALLEVEWRKMRRFEAAACRRASLTLAVSEADKAGLEALAPGARVAVVPTGVDTSFFRPEDGRDGEAGIVFTGSMDWHPNEDAVLHFLGSILPLVRRELPGARLTIVGRNPSERLRAACAAAAAHVTGTVDDVRPFVASASVCVVPLRIGGGTRLKIFEALAMGKAVVSTAVGAEGLPLVPGEHYLHADDPAAFAASVVSLVRDRERRRRIGAAGRRLVEEQYGWSRAARTFDERCSEVLARTPRRSRCA
jgi:sugar transferase (PEP-CTERM/EpsH1 system associated)